MASDAYIKFGEGTETDSDTGELMPLLMGDSDDFQHYWWCELRGCDFEMEASEKSEGEGNATDKHGEKPRPELKPITIKKRVDWASTQLFMKCCEAAEAAAKKTDEEQAKGRIKEIIIHVCRQSGEKFPFLIVKYLGAMITRYAIDMSGPEPAETITFKAESSEFIYQRTNPIDGKKKDGPIRTGTLASYTQSPASGGEGSSPASATAPASGGGAPASLAATAAVGIAAAAATGSSSGGASQGAIATPTDAAVSANFPGLSSGLGLGVLPD